MKFNDRKEIIFTWQEFWQYCEVVTQAIVDKGRTYSQIVAILRGGFYFGDYLSRRLQIPLSAMVAQSYAPNHQRGELRLGELSYIHPPQGRILLVDDLLDSGMTMSKIKKQLANTWKVEIDTAVIWQKSQSKFQADYYYSITPREYWIIQPFEL